MQEKEYLTQDKFDEFIVNIYTYSYLMDIMYHT